MYDFAVDFNGHVDQQQVGHWTQLKCLLLSGLLRAHMYSFLYVHVDGILAIKFQKVGSMSQDSLPVPSVLQKNHIEPVTFEEAITKDYMMMDPSPFLLHGQGPLDFSQVPYP